nr:MAG TPA: hypothetical protein [Caudoviricetes sp.]
MATEKKKIIVGRKEYTMPTAEVDAYLHYLEVRDSIMDVEKKSGLYTYKQFMEIMECICEMYGNQFTVDELKDKETGLSVGAIVAEFALIETGITKEVNGRMEKITENFSSGK